MLKSLKANKSSFQEVTFKKGFNVVLADRVSKSSEKESRNGVGKSTLIEIIHFCLGSKVNKDSVLKTKQLEDWTFILELAINGDDYKISRNTKDSANIYVEGDTDKWYVKPSYERKTGRRYFTVKDWNNVLGNLMFGLSESEADAKYSPSFRSLISYFARRGVGGFYSPFKHFPQQKAYDIQVCNAYLLGLNYQYASRFQEIKDKKKALDDLKKAANTGVLTNFMGSLGELNAEKVRIEQDIKNMEVQLGSFQVHPQYYEIEAKANAITKQIHKITNDYTINKQMYHMYTDNTTNENKEESISQVERIYREAGFIFNSEIKKTLDEVKTFHQNVIQNRREYLTQEIARLSRKVKEQEIKIEELSSERAELLEILKTHGALAEYTKLQERLSSLKQQFEEVKQRIDDYKRFEEGKSNLKIENEELLINSRRDLDERQYKLQEAISLFNSNSQYLYSEPGILAIDVNKNGYKFDVDIKRARSQGIGYMKVFCYDLMLMQLGLKKEYSSDFLVHDSTIFDGVDERQIAKALELAFREANVRDFQYLCLLNSDIIPYKEFSDEFETSFKESIIKKFTDEHEQGSLLGFRF